MHQAQPPLIRHLQRLLGSNGSNVPGDVELLERYLRQHDEAAFELLVWRHGALVWNLCRGMLGDHHLAEDAFQATFLTFVRKAGSIGKRESVSSWLYKVAFRVALLTRDQQVRRAARETNDVSLLAGKQSDEIVWRDLRPVLYDEVNRLPGKYRVAFILCYLQGKTNAEAARQLGCPEGTVVSRLASARRRLRRRLTGRGVTLGTGLLAGLLTEQVSASAIPASFITATAKAALQFGASRAAGTAIATSQAIVLAERLLNSMMLNKLRKTVAIAFVLSFLGAGTGLCLQNALAGKRSRPAVTDVQQSATQDIANLTKADLDRMQGTWETTETVYAFSSRDKLTVETKRKVKWVFSGNKLFRLGEDGFIDEEWTIKLDATKDPKTIDRTSPRLGKMEGIYRLEGDALIVCSGRKRSAAFPSNIEDSARFTRVSRTPATALPRFANAPGCYWMVEPSALGSSSATLGITYFYDQDHDGAAVVTMAYTPFADEQRSASLYRPVLFDAAGKRYLPNSRGGAASVNPTGSGVELGRWRMDPAVLPAKKVALLGIEAVTAETGKIDSLEVLAEARKARIAVPPLPVVGQAYPFDLTTMAGNRITSFSLKGKVVVLEWWATWCAPCMVTAHQLRPLYHKWHEHGLEIVGINLDDKAATAQAACRRDGFDWPQVFIPADEKTRDVWQRATGVKSIPRLLLLDRDGILRADNPEKLEEQIAKLLATTPTDGAKSK
jgi:RNA polymerase sigma factor (sigma-70 family)